MSDETLDPEPVTRQLLVTVEVGRLGHEPTVNDWASFTRIRNEILRMADNPSYSNQCARVTAVEQIPSNAELHVARHARKLDTDVLMITNVAE